MLVNSEWDETIGRKDRQHGWIVMNTVEAMMAFNRYIKVSPVNVAKTLPYSPYKTDRKVSLTFNQLFKDSSMINIINTHGKFSGPKLLREDDFHVFVYLSKEKSYCIISFK
jgi:hypothetical protein